MRLTTKLVWISIQLVVGLSLCGCTTTRPNGVYVNHKLLVNNGTVEQFCQAGDNAQLIRNGKERLSQ